MCVDINELSSQNGIDFDHLVRRKLTEFHGAGILIDLGYRLETRDGDGVLAAAPDPGLRILSQRPALAGQNLADGFQGIQAFMGYSPIWALDRRGELKICHFLKMKSPPSDRLPAPERALKRN